MSPTENSEEFAALVTDQSLEAAIDDEVQGEQLNAEAVLETQTETETGTETAAELLEPAEQSLTHEGLTIATNNEEAETTNADSHNGAIEQVANAGNAEHNNAKDEVDADDVDADADVDGLAGAPVPHALNKKQREDVESSDDEDAGGIEMNPTFNSEWETLAKDLAAANDAANDLNNDIDVYDTVPVDLSNDIAVNDAAAADPNYQPNPDAEFIDVDISAAEAAEAAAGVSMPKFEKLSLTPAIEPTSYQQEPLHEMK